MYKVFDTLQEYNQFTNDGANLTAGVIYYIKEDGSTHFQTNNINGEEKVYDMIDGIPEGYIKPTGNISITENGENINVNEYSTASVNVPIPDGYIVPSGNKEITENGTNIDVAQYATATVAVPQPTGNISITANGENIDIAQYATASVNVPSGTEDVINLIERDFTTFNIPSGITKIGDYAFHYCSALTSVEIPNSVISIGKYAFYRCNKLSSVTIPNSVTSIGSSAFGYCSALPSVEIPNSVTSIGDSAFGYCSALPSVEIPNSVTSIGDSAFDECSKLSTITINATTPPTFGPIYSMEFYVFVPSESVDTYKATNVLKQYPNNIYSLPILKGEYLTGTIEMPSNRDVALSNIFYQNYPKYFDKLYINDIEVSTDYSLKKNTSYTFKFELFDKRLIGGRLFSDNNFVTSVTIPNSVTRIGNNAFMNCKITNINIPESVTNIGRYAFQSTALTEITIPSSVTEIGYNILEYNNVITSITILATTPPTLSSKSISGSNNCPIYVPAESVDAYKAATNWSSLADRITAIVA